MERHLSSSSQKKITVVLPGELLSRLDEIVPRRARSHFIAEAIEEQLAIAEQSAALAAAAGSWTDEDYPHLRTNQDIDRWLGELRASWIIPTEVADE